MSTPAGGLSTPGTALRVLALLLAMLGAASGARAQGLSIQFVPRLGAFVPTRALSDFHGQFSSFEATIAPGLAAGAALELAVPGAPVTFRGTLDYVAGTQLAAKGLTADTTTLSLLAVGGDVVVRPFGGEAARPYFLVGAGVKHYHLVPGSLVRSIRGAFTDDRTDNAAHFGVGVDVRLGALTTLVELTDWVSRFGVPATGRQRVQHDVFVMGGLRVGLF